MDKASSFRRIGECSRCGRCCNINSFKGTSTTIGQTREDGYCVWYYQDGELGGCLKHHTSRGKPPICEAFPMTPKDIETIPECTYSFERVYYLPDKQGEEEDEEKK